LLGREKGWLLIPGFWRNESFEDNRLLDGLSIGVGILLIKIIIVIL
jgi:hypothetical protein